MRNTVIWSNVQVKNILADPNCNVPLPPPPIVLCGMQMITPILLEL